MSGDVLAVSYRQKEHVFPDKKIIDRSPKKPDSVIEIIWSYIFAIIMVHYFLWSIAMYTLVFILWYMGHPYIALSLVLIYLPSFLRGDQFKTGRPWPELRRSTEWWSIQRYLGVEVVRTAELDSSKQYIFGIHPHGILILSRPSLYGGVWEALFPGIELRALGASPMFWIPGCRELCLWLDAINAAKSVAMRALHSTVQKNEHNHSGKLSLMVYPGGSKEIFTTDPKSKESVLIARKGFIKLAIQSGCSLVPAFVFGEKWMYERKFLPKSIMDFFMKTLRLPLIIFFGRWWTWIPLQRKPITVVFGEPIQVEKMDNPNDEYINQIFEKFYGQIRKLFEDHKGKLGYDKDEVLVIKVQEETKTNPKQATPLE